jgi:hypothetical protein
MPEISRFYGIVIRMFFDDHRPPHFHAYYGSDEAIFDIETAATLAGRIPPRASGLVTEWIMLHREELQAMWQRAEELQPLGKIAPLP